MNFKKYHVSRNLFDEVYPNISGTVRYRALNLGNGTYTLSSTVEISQGSAGTLFFLAGDVSSGASTATNAVYKDRPITVTSTDGYVTIAYRTYTTDTPVGKETMLNEGSQPLPYEPYGSTWTDTPHYIMGTSTDTITTLPAVLYPNAATVTVGLKGNMEQTGTPTPDSPIMPDGCGDLETVGAKAGQYKIPISSASTTTPVYLGEVETTRKIGKLVLTGEENWRYSTTSQAHWIENVPNDYDNTLISQITTVCTHYKCIQNNTGFTGMVNGNLRLYTKGSSPIAHELYIKDETYTSAADFKAYLAAQYAAGTPVCVWYVLATEETGIINEPLMKIGDYADIISGISIPTTAGANTLDVGTTVQPSEVTASFNGWHPVSSAHERENGAWT